MERLERTIYQIITRMEQDKIKLAQIESVIIGHGGTRQEVKFIK
jgi:hypothetical protein